MAEDFIGLAVSAVIILLGDKIATKFFLGEYFDVFVGLLVLAGIVIFFLGPLFIFKTIRANKIANNLHELHQKNERRKDERKITDAQLRVVDQEITLVMLQQTEILEKNQRLWVKYQIVETQEVLKGQLDLEIQLLDQEDREKAEMKFQVIMESFNTLKQEFIEIREKLEVKKEIIANDTDKNINLITQTTESKESKKLKELQNKELNDALKDITATLPPDKKPDLDKIID